MELNWSEIAGKLAVAALGLVLFGIAYNQVVERFQKRTQHYTAELVVAGVLVTLIVSGFVVGWGEALIVFLLFACSGTPMVIGSMLRNAREGEAAKKIVQESIKDLVK